VGSRYKDARAEIRALFARNPQLTAKQLWHEMTDSWPIPSERTIQRVMQEAKRDLAVAGKVAASSLDSSAPSDTLVATAVLPMEIPNMDKLDEMLSAVKTMCDGVNARCDAIAAEQKTLADRMDAEREKVLTDAAAAQVCNDSAQDRYAYANAQIRADRGFNAWSKSAPHALSGESLRDFRIRLLRELQPLSKTFKDSDLSMIGDEKAFTIIEDAIINDAVQASIAGDFTPGAPLRESVTKTEHGQVMRKFHGDPNVCWAPFAGVARRGRIIRPQQH
jgi:hypothetical protein